MSRRGDWSRASIARDRERFEADCAAKDAARRAESGRKVAEYRRLVAEGMSPAEAEVTVELATIAGRLP